MAHIHEKIDFTVETFIIHNKRVLLRKHDKYKIWLSIGGHIDLDEDPNEAAVREVKEEVGLSVELIGKPVKTDETKEYHELLPPRFMNRHRINETHEHVTAVYFARSESDIIVQADNEKSEACRWFTEVELDDPKYGISRHIRYYAKAALAEGD